jgi:hypothetical protein
MEICENCDNRKPDVVGGFCGDCRREMDAANEDMINDREAYPEELPPEEDYESSEYSDAYAQEPGQAAPQEQTKPERDGVLPQSGLKGAAISGAAGALVGAENAEKATKLASQVEKGVATARATVARAGWAAKAAVAAFGNPVTWIAIAVVVVIFIVGNVATTTYQTVGSIAVDGQETGSGAGSELLARLAQRGTLLVQEGYKYPNVDPFVTAHGGNAGKTNGNRWNAACPDIVNIIYGMPELYIGNNGIVNSYQNYKRLTAAGLQAQSWWFPETSSPGATKEQPPAGAIVQSTGSGPAGHTYVVLTDDGKVIDNTWSIRDGGPVAGPGYRTLDDRSRAGIRGWFVPPAEGYEGTFLNDDPMLPPAPEWILGQGESSGGGSGGPATAPSGNPQQIAQKMVKAKGWSDADFTCLVKLWTRESSWNPSANNASSGAYGIPQALPGSKMASAGADWKTNPETQIKWGLGYIEGRYKNPCGAWAHSESHNWY